MKSKDTEILHKLIVRNNIKKMTITSVENVNNNIGALIIDYDIRTKSI